MRFTTFLLLLAVVPIASAQIVASERGSVSQIVDGTHLRVDYSRPRLRGRDSVFGKLEPWGRAWTPGADSATTLLINKNVRLLGVPVPAGKYSVWLVPRAGAPWTFVLDPRTTLYHTAHPESTSRQIRVPVIPKTVPRTDVLTWSFPSISNTGTTLEMRWETTAIELPIDVPATYPVTVSAADAAPYLGEYELVNTHAGVADPPIALTISRRDDGVMLGQWFVNGTARGWQLLQEGRPDTFVQGNRVRDELWWVVSWQRVEFKRGGDGQVTGFEIRNDTAVSARGTRKP